jgi:hypothetical protein
MQYVCMGFSIAGDWIEHEYNDVFDAIHDCIKGLEKKIYQSARVIQYNKNISKEVFVPKVI